MENIKVLLLAISLSLDAFGIGISYGIRNKKISLLYMFFIYLTSIIINFISINIGENIFSIMSPKISIFISTSMLLTMGIITIIKSIIKKKFIKSQNNKNKINNSNNVIFSEVMYLSLTLNIDSIGIGISSSTISNLYKIIPIIVSLFQSVLLKAGIKIGIQLNNSNKKINNNENDILNIISGLLLIIIGLMRIII